MKKNIVTGVLASIFILLCVNCNGVDQLGRLPLTSHATSTDITIKPKHWSVAVSASREYDPEDVTRFIDVRAFIVNQGNETLRLGVQRASSNGTKYSEHIETLLPGGRVLFHEGPLIGCNTAFVEVPERSSPQKFRIEIEPISNLVKDYQLTIYARWGHGIDL